jgi:hypothetical protein
MQGFAPEGLLLIGDAPELTQKKSNLNDRRWKVYPSDSFSNTDFSRWLWIVSISGAKHVHCIQHGGGREEHPRIVIIDTSSSSFHPGEGATAKLTKGTPQKPH